MEHHVPREIVEYYKPYENKQANHIVVQNVLGASKFELEDKYSIIDSSTLSNFKQNML